jgi:hypothetical protein
VTALALVLAFVALTGAGLAWLALRRRAGQPAPAVDKPTQADSTSASTFDASMIPVITASAPVHVNIDSGCVAAHAGSMDCGSHGGH